MPGRRRFRGTLESDHSALRWTLVRVPFEPTEVWPRRKGLRVRGTLRAALAKDSPAVALRTSLFRGRDRVCVLMVNKRMQKAAGVSRGSVVDITLEPDTEERPVVLPPELDRLLRQDRALRKWHDGLSASWRKAIAEQIMQPKSAAARASRAELWAERMLLVMEGERITPPVLEVLLNRTPRAHQGWLAMTPLQRRGHLMGIFYCQGPESRKKRAEKAVAEALRVADRKDTARS
ncbi:MAG TPA: YdeI/OmpD-associated family protein [Acidobacteriaceae bacterium]|nr:YdeI/OmpD-associated family protein [Acidobacteriaceae bacterium]